MNGKRNPNPIRPSSLIRWLVPTILLITAFVPQIASAQGCSQWTGQYFNNQDLAGSPTLTRCDDRINFDWGVGSPDPSIPADHFSVRWTRNEWMNEGTYRFSARADDGIRFWLGDNLIIDTWVDQQGGWIIKDLYIPANTYQMRVEYYENTGAAFTTFNWEHMSGGAGWQGSYYSNKTLSGSPTLQRTDPAINFNWGYGSPAESIPPENFSVRWTQSMGLPAGNYRIYASSDDGVRVFVDNQLVINAWFNQVQPNTHQGDITLGAGTHSFKVEYFEDTGEANVRVWGERLDDTPSTDVWTGEYFANQSLSGSPALVRYDAQINFDWGAGSPAPQIPSDHFSVRWTRQFNVSDGSYRISTQSDDGVRVWVDGRLVIDQWRVLDFEFHSADVQLASGLHDVRVEYFEDTGNARIVVWAEQTSGSTPPPPSGGASEVIVDNGSPGFTTGGNPNSWKTASTGYGGSMVWTYNNETAQPDYNWARWIPNLRPGRYAVSVYIPAQNATTNSATYWIAHRDGSNPITLSQASNAGKWFSLGTYNFAGGQNEYVSLSDVTGEPYLSRQVGFDAIKWESR